MAAVFLGLAGSAHCVAMCGGVAAALDRAASGTGWRRSGFHALYAMGRLGSYALLGALVGALGHAVGTALPTGSQLGLRLAAGLLLIAIGISLAGFGRLRGIERVGAAAWRRLAPLSKRLSGLPAPLRALGLGALWGFLPCGLVYGAAGVAAVTGTAASGAIFMTAFGVGTTPAVFSLGVFASGVFAGLDRWNLRKLSACAVVLCGVWTIAGPIFMSSGHDH